MTDFRRGIFWISASIFSGTAMYVLAKDLLVTQTQAGCCYWWFGFAFLFYSLHLLSGAGGYDFAAMRRLPGWTALFLALQASNTALFFLGLKLMDPSMSSFLQRSQVVFTIALGAVFLGERLRRGEWTASLMIIGGLFMITFHGGGVSIAGSAAILGSTFLGSACAVVIRKVGCRVGAQTLAFARTAALLGMYLLYAAFTPGSFSVPPGGTLAKIAAGSFLGPFFMVAASYKALEYMEAGKAALLGSLQPFFIMAGAFLVFGTFPGRRGILGGALMIAGNILFIRANLGKRRVPAAGSEPERIPERSPA